MSPDKETNRHHQPQSFRDFPPGFGQYQNLAGNGIDHHKNRHLPWFSGSFPFDGPWHHHDGSPRHPVPRRGARREIWDVDFDWDEWFGHGRRRDPRDHDHDRRRSRGHDSFYHDEHSDSEDGHRSTTEEEMADVPDPEEVAPEDAGEHTPPSHGADRRGGRFHRKNGWRHGLRGRGHHSGHHSAWGRDGRRHCPRRNSPDVPSMIERFMSHPFFHNMHDQAEYRHRSGSQNGEENGGSASFQPPIDIFNTEASYVVHVALPGAKKDDMGVNWNPDTKTLTIAGVVHRPGDAAFIQALVSGERTVGVFERAITLPPAAVADRDDVDGLGITAKMEDGLLVVVVPKVEREWTDVRKVDVQ
ncbi:hypothetical protein ED733_005851 [Metarhizium rileyi]|uniref:SHSP domain-containing protein n=1 Tax=Metarhizium rileyi (strain RCEF 4871) TaxID=1649241 RepID=A0A5C6GE91_METRR|nr:hypothetical protein ED733_005851 [Metarhizium rileyi]